MGAYILPFAKAKPRIRSHVNDFRSHCSNPLSMIVDTCGGGHILSSVVDFACSHEIPDSTYVAGGRSTGTGCKYSARLQMALALAR